MSFTFVFMLVQVFFAVVIGLYFWNLLRNQRTNRTSVDKESRKELEKLRKLRSISLSQPLAEKTRPQSIADIVGQQEGLRALKAALCGANPQHVIIYGPPGVGKTAAARVLLEEAKRFPASPFRREAKFLEIDATTARFDERGIADPLIGSVHDPIYQGAGAMGVAGIPQPKPGAVTKAHGGILFIDEIGELHPVQMNKLLKVLEDRKVFLESSYYNSEDHNIPGHIHDIFQNGLPADFRLVGATTRTPQEIPAAIRSRCIEIFFRPLLAKEISEITEKAIARIGFPPCVDAVTVVSKYATNGREAVNMIQLAVGLAMSELRSYITSEDVEWVVNSSQIQPRLEKFIPTEPQVGVVNGLAVYGINMGTLVEIEVTAFPAFQSGAHQVTLTGIVEEEEMGGGSRTVRRKSMAKSSIDNVFTVLRKFGIEPGHYDLHINLPGGIPIDGPSAGIAIAVGVASAIRGIQVDNTLAMTGEVSIHGKVKPVGGIVSKVEAAIQAGAKRIIIPKENWLEHFAKQERAQIIAVATIDEVFEHALDMKANGIKTHKLKPSEILTASPVSMLQAEASYNRLTENMDATTS